MNEKTKANARPNCRFCGSSKTIKNGTRVSKREKKQVFICKKCGKRFVNSAVPNFTYPAQAIIAAPIFYYQGYSLTDTRKRIIGRFKTEPSQATVGNWVKEFGKHSALKKHRNQIKEHSKPHKIIRHKLLKHKQNYLLQVHNYKLENLPSQFRTVMEYLQGILEDKIKIDHNQFLLRGSNFGLDVNYMPRPYSKPCYENKVADISLKAARTNHHRHSIIQKFYLATDMSTVAVEVPVYLTPQETETIIKSEGDLLGHIDFLQVLNGRLRILDYKPEASKQKHVVDQLLLYAIALSTRTGIHLKYMDCAWFDEKNYYKFKAIDAYYKMKEKFIPCADQKPYPLKLA